MQEIWLGWASSYRRATIEAVAQESFSVAAVLAHLVVSCGRQTQPAPAADTERTPATILQGSAPTVTERSLPFGGGLVRLHSPADHTKQSRLPFVLALHGLGGSGEQIAGDLALARFATELGFHYVAPDGTMDARGRRFWNAGRICCDFFGTEINDVVRLGTLIEQAVDISKADPSRVYVVGYSNGGFMAHRLACERASRIQGIVSIAAAGPAIPQECAPERPVSVLEIHGDRDTVVPFDGGHLFGVASYPETPSVWTGLATWASLANCAGKLLPGERLDLVAGLAGTETQTLGYARCERAIVRLWKVEGGSHALRLNEHAWQAIWSFWGLMP